MQEETDPFIIRVDVKIAGIDPPIFRTLELPQDLNFAQLHEVLQAVFGWSDSHLHQFNLAGLIVGAPEMLSDGLAVSPVLEATDITLGHLTFPHGPDPVLTIFYEYDFGDSWQHVLTLRRALRKDGARYPRCIDGARAGPPEDVGGSSGYTQFFSAWLDPEHEDHLHHRRWAGRTFEPERFDMEKTNKAVIRALRLSKGDYSARLLPSAYN